MKDKVIKTLTIIFLVGLQIFISGNLFDAHATAAEVFIIELPILIPFSFLCFKWIFNK